MKIYVDVDDFARRMEHRADSVKNHIQTGMEKLMAFIHSRVPPAPPQSGKSFRFVSKRQWLFVTLSIREGSMRVPYRRTSTLLRSITTEVKPMGSSYVGSIGTNIVYAPWVISSEPFRGIGGQAEYHKGHWWTLQDVVMKAIGEAVTILRNHVAKGL